MSNCHAERRCHPRKNCRGSVLVYELTSGLPYTGELIDISRGGIRLSLDRRLDADEVVRILFPNRNSHDPYQGRMIIGRVVHSSSKGGRHVIRVAFGWDAAVTENPIPIRRDPKSSSIFRRFTRRLTPGVFSAWRRA